MASAYQAIVQRPGDLWIGWIAGIPGISAQATTHDGLLENLRATLREASDVNCHQTLAPFDGTLEEVSSVSVGSAADSGWAHCNMPRHVLLSHLLDEGCALIREGLHASWWANSSITRQCAVPDLTEFAFIGIHFDLVQKICRDLQIEELVATIVSRFR
jgi:hypothetical protein